MVLVTGAATWVATWHRKRPAPGNLLLGLGAAALASTTVYLFGVQAAPGGLLPILNACALAGSAAAILIAFAVPVAWGSAMACHEAGPAPRRLTARRIGGMLALSGFGLLLIGSGVEAMAAYGWNVVELQSWETVVLRIFHAVSVACAGWAAWLSILLADTTGDLRSRALRIHHLNLLSIAAEVPLLSLWVGTGGDGLLYRLSFVCRGFLIPLLLRLSLAFHVFLVFLCFRKPPPGYNSGPAAHSSPGAGA